MKRGRESLTGGTGDVNPQWFKCTAGAQTTSTFATTTFAAPNNRLESPSNPTIMEVLKVQWVLFGTPTVTAGTSGAGRFYLTTKSYGTVEPSINEGPIFDSLHLGIFSIAASTDSGTLPLEYWHDLTDETGHGVLVATDNIYLGVIGTASTPFTNLTCTARILYRFKRVSLAEYIGIVQSQQT